MKNSWILGSCVSFFLICAVADAQPVSFFQGFETDTAGWFDPGEVNRVASGSTSTTYASGISAASGGFFARLGLGATSTCSSAGGLRPVTNGPFTRWGCYTCSFPASGYKSEISIFLDAGFAATHADARFDWASAVNTAGCTFRRDFVYNVGTCGPTQPFPCGTTGQSGFVISASNNSTRCGAFPANPGNSPFYITQSGWYRFEHVFNNVAGILSVTFNLYDAGGTLLNSWTRSDPSDVIGTTVGGNRYGWFPNQEIPDLAIDDSERIGGQACGTFNCSFPIGGKGNDSCSVIATLPAPVASPSPAPSATIEVSCTTGDSLKDVHASSGTPDSLIVIKGVQDGLEAILSIDGLDPATGERSSTLETNLVGNMDSIFSGSCTFSPLSM